jgi:hypothetical protein
MVVSRAELVSEVEWSAAWPTAEKRVSATPANIDINDSYGAFRAKDYQRQDAKAAENRGMLFVKTEAVASTAAAGGR